MNEDQAKGMFLGLAIGDALGTTLEFSRPTKDTPQHTKITGGGPFMLPAGYWTDDTSMAIAMSHSLISCGEFDPTNIMEEFNAWKMEGRHSPTNRCVDIGTTTRESLENWNWERPYVGPVSDDTSGNGGIMRMAPIIIWNHDNYPNALVDAVRQSMITHASEDCVRYAQAMADVLWSGVVDTANDARTWPDKFDTRGMPYSGGYVKETFTAACWCIDQTTSFYDALVTAVNLGYDADTVGAVTGQIAGRIYGAEAIPDEWLDVLAWRDKIEDLARRLYEGCS